MDNKTILIVDPNGIDTRLSEFFNQLNYNVEVLDLFHPEYLSKNHPDAAVIHRSCLLELSIIDERFQKRNLPLIVLDDSFNESVCVQYLDAGADDYLVKPINPRELYARINAILKRVQAISHGHELESYTFDEWTLYPSSRRLFNKSAREVVLSQSERDMLLVFLMHPQKTLDREYLLKVTKDEDYNPLDRRVDVQISRLRQKVEEDSQRPKLIKTIRNGGYMFTPKVTHYR